LHKIGNGPAEIMEMMQHIPRTKHPLESASNQHKFVLDLWQMLGLVNEATSPKINKKPLSHHELAERASKQDPKPRKWSKKCKAQHTIRVRCSTV
jgi:hypothetical protein